MTIPQLDSNPLTQITQNESRGLYGIAVKCPGFDQAK